MTTFFCDGLKNVSVVNGVARLEFHRLEPSGRDHEFRATNELVLALPVAGLIDAITMLGNVRGHLAPAGLDETAEPRNGTPPSPPPPQSPNFMRKAAE